MSIRETPVVSALGALAFTCGERISFGPGRYDVHSHAGIELLGHELAHVLQQRAGRVPASRALVPLVHEPVLEAEADELGRRLADWWMTHPSIHEKSSAWLCPGEPAWIVDFSQTGPARPMAPAVLQARLDGPTAFELFMYYSKAYPDREDLQALCREMHKRLVRGHDSLQSAKAEVHRVVGPPTSEHVAPPGWKPFFVIETPPVPSLRSIMGEQSTSSQQQSTTSPRPQPKTLVEILRSSPQTSTPLPKPKVVVDKIKPILERVASWDHKSQASITVSLTSTQANELIARASEITTTSGKNFKYEVIDNGGSEEKYDYARVIKIVYWFGSQITTGMTGGLKKPTFHVILRK